MDGHLVAGQVVIDEEAGPCIDREFLHQRGADAHGHRPDHLAAGGLGIENPAGSADGEHAPYPDFLGGPTDPAITPLDRGG